MFKIFKLIIVLAIALAITLAGVAFWFFGGLYNSAKNNAMKLTIDKGQTVTQIAAKLKDSGLIDSDLLFKLLAKIKGLALNLKAGEYAVPANVNLDQLIKIFAIGPAPVEKVVLVKEGMTDKAIEEYLKADKLIIDGSFIRLATTLLADLPAGLKTKYPFLAEAPQKVDLEGFLFPDTYRLYADDGGEVLVGKMLADFDTKVTPEMRTEIKRQGKSLYQILIISSIIEKEVRSTDDMKIVSGIFWDRLKNGQRLESCATLAYVLGVNKPQYSYEDTQIDSPYNTYRIDGLPPTPIGNPGLRAIEAAVYPDITGYRFFLTDPATGNTVWARTFEEHKANKAKYLK